MENQTSTPGLTIASQQESNPPESRVCSCSTELKPEWVPGYKLGTESIRGFWIPAAEKCGKCSEPEPEPELSIEQKLNGIGIPRAYINMTFDNYKCEVDNEKSFHILQEYVEKPKGGIYVCGDCGIGKTHLSVALARKLILQKKDVRFCVVPELLLYIKTEIFETKSISEDEMVEAFASVDYLILDDLGAEKVTEFTLQTLYLILDRRLRNARSNLIITSNLTIEKISDRLSDRIASRIAGMCRIVRFTGADHRLKRHGR